LTALLATTPSFGEALQTPAVRLTADLHVGLLGSDPSKPATMAWVIEQVMEGVLPFDHVIAQLGLG